MSQMVSKHYGCNTSCMAIFAKTHDKEYAYMPI
jgi:hypothetical protein